MAPDQTMLLQNNFGFFFGGAWLFLIAFFVLLAVSLWKIFTKAGKPGWAAIVPIYNIIVELEIIGQPLWMIALFFVPFVNYVVMVIIKYHLACAFGKGVGFTIGLIFLPFIFYPILAFGKATYQGPIKMN